MKLDFQAANFSDQKGFLKINQILPYLSIATATAIDTTQRFAIEILNHIV